MDRGDLQQACPKLEESFQLAPRLGTMLNLGGCYEHGGQLARALGIYERAATMAHEAGRQDRELAARELAAQVEPRVARLLLAVTDPPPDLTVQADGDVVSTRGGLIPLDPGQRRIRAAAPGKIAFETTLTARAGETLRVTIPRLEDAPRTSAAPAESPMRAPPHAFSARSLGIVGGVAVAAAGAIVGTVFGIQAWQKRNESNAFCDASGCSQQGIDRIGQAKAAGNVSTIAFAGAGAGLACGAAFFFLAPAPSPSRVSLGIGPGAVAIRASF
jgi:hypothetical protein